MNIYIYIYIYIYLFINYFTCVVFSSGGLILFYSFKVLFFIGKASNSHIPTHSLCFLMPCVLVWSDPSDDFIFLRIGDNVKRTVCKFSWTFSIFRKLERDGGRRLVRHSKGESKTDGRSCFQSLNSLWAKITFLWVTCLEGGEKRLWASWEMTSEINKI